MAERLVVIGAGMAAGRLLEHLSDEAPGRYAITLFNAEPCGTYNRIQLSPVLAGETGPETLVTHDDAWYAARGIVCRFGERVLEIDRAAKVVQGENGPVSYDRLVIATGSHPVTLPLRGADLARVIAWRDHADTDAMIAAAASGARAVVIGGGLLGLEAAAGLRARGAEVTVVHRASHLMNRQIDAAAGFLLRKALTDRGIRVICGANSREILGENGHVRALVLDDGTELPCELLVMAVGIRPASGLGRAAGLTVNHGIIVDDGLATSDPAIFGLGECVEHHGELFGLVAPLYDQARVLADRLMDRPAAFRPPVLSTRLKVTGCDIFSAGDFAPGEAREEIVLSDPTRGAYRRLVIEDDRLIGAVFYGDSRDAGWFDALIREGTDLRDLRQTLIFGPADPVPEPQPYGGLCSLTA